MTLRYRGIDVTEYRPPVPNNVRWQWAHPDYDGAPDSGDDRCGYGRTLRECMQQIDETLGTDEPYDDRERPPRGVTCPSRFNEDR